MSLFFKDKYSALLNFEFSFLTSKNLLIVIKSKEWILSCSLLIGSTFCCAKTAQNYVDLISKCMASSNEKQMFLFSKRCPSSILFGILSSHIFEESNCFMSQKMKIMIIVHCHQYNLEFSKNKPVIVCPMFSHNLIIV